jgi:hypothetical protein
MEGVRSPNRHNSGGPERKKAPRGEWSGEGGRRSPDKSPGPALRRALGRKSRIGPSPPESRRPNCPRLLPNTPVSTSKPPELPARQRVR